MRKLPDIGKFLAIAVTAAVTAYPFSGFAETDCPAIPKVTFWGEVTHTSVRQHVKDKLAGNWVAYLNQLQRQQTTLTKFSLRGSGAVIKRKGKN